MAKRKADLAAAARFWEKRAAEAAAQASVAGADAPGVPQLGVPGTVGGLPVTAAPFSSGREPDGDQAGSTAEASAESAPVTDAEFARPGPDTLPDLSPFAPGSYRREEDGAEMVEVAPGSFVSRRVFDALRGGAT